MRFYEGPRLLDLAKTPHHLQFNKYVLTGYRPVSTAHECLRSLFYMHNELGNIYTHGQSNTSTGGPGPERGEFRNVEPV